MPSDSFLRWLSFSLLCGSSRFSFFFFFNDTATTEIYTLSLHDALPIYAGRRHARTLRGTQGLVHAAERDRRSEEHTSELQSPCNLVCRLLLEKKKKKKHIVYENKKNDNDDRAGSGADSALLYAESRKLR